MSSETSASKKVDPVIVPTQQTPIELDASKRVSSRKPRHRYRSVPMKILVLGLPRTGTLSIRQALFQLGYFDVYHGTAFNSEDDHGIQLWQQAFHAKFENGPPFLREDWDEIFGHYMAVSDWPSVVFAEELIQAYPEAKVILSIRDNAEIWKRSAENTVVAGARMSRPQSILTKVVAYFAPSHRMSSIYPKLVDYDRLLQIPEDGISRYHEHNAFIKKLVRPENLLVFNVKQGWKPMCEFLDCAVPDLPFPRVNDEKAFLEALNKAMKEMGSKALWNMACAIGPVIAIIVSLLLWFLYVV